jgi:hypothetical protein
MNSAVEMGITLVGMVGAIALASVLVSRNSQTPAVIQAGASGLANNLAVAESPVTGVSYQPSLGYPAPNEFASGFGT